MKEVFLTIALFVVSLLLVILFIALGWYIVWKLFLSKFKFVRELLGKNESESQDEAQSVKKTRTKIRRD